MGCFYQNRVESPKIKGGVMESLSKIKFYSLKTEKLIVFIGCSHANFAILYALAYIFLIFFIHANFCKISYRIISIY